MGKTHRDIGVYTEGTLIALYVASGKIFRSLVASFQWELYTRDSCVMSVPIYAVKHCNMYKVCDTKNFWMEFFFSHFI